MTDAAARLRLDTAALARATPPGALGAEGARKKKNDAPAAVESLGAVCSALVAHANSDLDETVPFADLRAGAAAVARALAALGRPGAPPPLARLAAPAWAADVLPALEALFFGPRWHLRAAAADPAPDAAGAARDAAALRDAFRDGYLPALAAAAAAQADGRDAQVAAQLAAAARIAGAAADAIGWRLPGVHAAPAVRSYALVNAAWLGLMRAWAAAPPALRPPRGAPGAGADALAARLGVQLRADAAGLAARRDAADAKLLQFWLAQAGRLAAAAPDAAPAVAAAARGFAADARARLARLADAHAGDAGAAATLRAVEASSVWVRAARLQAQCVAVMGGEAGGRFLDSLAEEAEAPDAEATGGDELRQAGALLALLDVLAQAALLPAAALGAAARALDAALRALPDVATAAPEGAAAALRAGAAAAAAACLAACSAAGGAGGADAAAAAAAWDSCVVALLAASATPHPALAPALARAWAAAGARCDEATAKQLASALHALLAAAAAADAAAAGDAGADPPSPAAAQLTALLAALLGASPEPLAAAFFGHFLAGCETDARDGCRVAVLAAVARAATLADAAGGRAAALGAVQALAAGLGPELDGPKAADPVHAALVADALAACLEHLAAAAAAARAPAGAEPALRALAARLAAHVAARAAARAPPVLWAAPLAALGAALRADAGCLPAGALHALVPAARAAAAAPRGRAAAAALAPELRLLNAPPAGVFEALLGAPANAPAARHAAAAAYVAYARRCEPDAVLGVLPAALRDPATGELEPGFRAVVQAHLQRGGAAAEAAERGAPAARRALARALAAAAAAEGTRLRGAAARAAAAHGRAAAEAGEGAVDAALRDVAAAAERLERACAARADAPAGCGELLERARAAVDRAAVAAAPP
jgi:hypothetical protein